MACVKCCAAFNIKLFFLFFNITFWQYWLVFRSILEPCLQETTLTKLAGRRKRNGQRKLWHLATLQITAHQKHRSFRRDENPFPSSRKRDRAEINKIPNRHYTYRIVQENIFYINNHLCCQWMQYWSLWLKYKHACRSPGPFTGVIRLLKPSRSYPKPLAPRRGP